VRANQNPSLTILALLFLVAGVRAQQPNAPDPANGAIAPPAEPIVFPRVLTAFSTTPLTVPPFGSFGEPQCDDAGTMFFETGAPGQQQSIYLSISADGGRQVAYTVPKDLADGHYDTAYYAAADGRLHLLVMRPRIDVSWLRFDRDGKLEHEVKLEAPVGLYLDSFAVSAQGNLLLLAHLYAEGQHRAQEVGPFRAIFDSSGALIKKLTAGASGDEDAPMTPGTAQDRATAAGDEFYWTSGDSIIATDDLGNQKRSFRIPKPDHKDAVFGMRASGNLIEITIAPTPKVGETVKKSFMTLNSISGDSEGYFLPSPGIGNLACFDSKRGFTFIGGDNNGRLRLAEALLP
jgi:hypothetical protein